MQSIRTTTPSEEAAAFPFPFPLPFPLPAPLLAGASSAARSSVTAHTDVKQAPIHCILPPTSTHLEQ